MYYIATICYENETDRGTIKKTNEKVMIEAESAEEALMLANLDAAEDTRTSEVVAVNKAPIGYIICKEITPKYYNKIDKYVNTNGAV